MHPGNVADGGATSLDNLRCSPHHRFVHAYGPGDRAGGAGGPGLAAIRAEHARKLRIDAAAIPYWTARRWRTRESWDTGGG